jgi:hypothetical protein
LSDPRSSAHARPRPVKNGQPAHAVKRRGPRLILGTSASRAGRLADNLPVLKGRQNSTSCATCVLRH